MWYHRVVINRAKFDACTYSSFRGVKTDRQTELEELKQTDTQTELRFIY